MIGAINSIRLLLVSPDSPPHISRTCSRWRNTAPQPPGPGLGLHPPSVWITTVFSTASGMPQRIDLRRAVRVATRQPSACLWDNIGRLVRVEPLLDRFGAQVVVDRRIALDLGGTFERLLLGHPCLRNGGGQI